MNEPTRRHRRLAAVAILTIAIASTACADAEGTASQIAASTAPITTAAPDTTTSSTTAAPQGDPIELDIGLPRTIDYIWLETTVTGATIAAIEPRSFLRDEWVAGETTYLFLELDVANRSESEGLILTPQPYAVEVGDRRIPATEVLVGRTHVGLGPLGTEDKVIAFEVPAATAFDMVSLVVAHDDRIPAILPLVGNVPVDAFPVAAPVSGEGPAQGAVSGCNQPLDVTLLDARYDIELLESDAPPTVYGSRRAYVGDRFVSLDVRIYNNGGSRCGAGGTNYDPRLFRLLVDGVARAPATFLSGIIAAETAIDLTVHFTFPSDATTLEFVVGSDDGTAFTAPVDLAALPGLP